MVWEKLPDGNGRIVTQSGHYWGVVVSPAYPDIGVDIHWEVWRKVGEQSFRRAWGYGMNQECAQEAVEKLIEIGI